VEEEILNFGFWMAESFARCRCGRFFLSFKIHNPKFNIVRRVEE